MKSMSSNIYMDSPFLILIVLLAASIFCIPCRANIGDTAEQVKQKLGEPDHRYPISGSSHYAFSWIKDGLVTEIFFKDKVASVEEFTKTSSASHVSLDEARGILAAESDISNWAEYHLAGRVAWRNKIDGRGALLGSRILFVVKDGDWVQAQIGGQWPRP